MVRAWGQSGKFNMKNEVKDVLRLLPFLKIDQIDQEPETIKV